MLPRKGERSHARVVALWRRGWWEEGDLAICLRWEGWAHRQWWDIDEGGEFEGAGKWGRR